MRANPHTAPRTSGVATTTGTSASLSIALAGSGGSGVMTAGTLLLDAAARAGHYGLMVRTSGPQIRGGEAAALVRVGHDPVATLDDTFDVLLAIDWQNVHRFADEIPLGAHSVIIGDPDEGELPEVFQSSGARYFTRPLKKMAKGIPGSWTNMVALGLAGTLAGIPRRGARGRGAGVVEAHRGSAPREPGRARGRRGGRGRHRRRACTPSRDGHARQTLADQRQRGRGLRRDPGRRAFRRRVSDHAGDRAARVDGAGADQGRRHVAAGRRRAGLGQHDHRGVVRRCAVADRDRRPRPRADDRGHRARCHCGDPDRRRRCDARRPVDRHPGKERAKRSLVRGRGSARRRAASRARADVDLRLPRDDAMGRDARGSAAGAGDRAVGPVHGPVARDRRPAGRRRVPRQAAHRGGERAGLQALREHGVGRFADGDSRERPAPSTPPTASSTPKAAFRAAAHGTTRCSSTSASASSCGTTTAARGRTSKATASLR